MLSDILICFILLIILDLVDMSLEGVAKEVNKVAGWAWNNFPGLPKKEYERVVVEVREMLPQYGRNFYRLAGLSGAIAVGLGAYGAHVYSKEAPDHHMKVVYDTGNRYHFIHSLALLAVPFSRRPYIVGSLMTTGMLLFSGSCYYHALTGNAMVRKVTPYGGMLLILGWLSMIL